jgi:hypothetical protein
MSDEWILDLRIKLENRLSDILNIVELNKLITDLTIQTLKTITTDLKKIDKGANIISKANNSIQVIGSLDKNSKLKEQKEIIKEQVVVLLLGGLESYLNDVVRGAANNNPETFSFKNEKEKISFSHNLLRADFTLGDVVLEHILSKGFSFQDLRSTLEVFENYVGINIELDDNERDSLILLASLRHVIVHNRSIVDDKFLHQIRETSYASSYKKGQAVEVNDEIINRSRDSILHFSEQIAHGIINK